MTENVKRRKVLVHDNNGNWTVDDDDDENIVTEFGPTTTFSVALNVAFR